MMDEFPSSDRREAPFGPKRAANWRLFFFVLFVSPLVGSMMVGLLIGVSMVTRSGLAGDLHGFGAAFAAAAGFSIALYPIGLPIALICAGFIVWSIRSYRALTLKAVLLIAGGISFLFGLIGLPVVMAVMTFSRNLVHANPLLSGLLFACLAIATSLLVWMLALRLRMTTRDELLGRLP